jgi:hypothetical protein
MVPMTSAPAKTTCRARILPGKLSSREDGSESPALLAGASAFGAPRLNQANAPAATAARISAPDISSHLLRMLRSYQRPEPWLRAPRRPCAGCSGRTWLLAVPMAAKPAALLEKKGLLMEERTNTRMLH